jgi:hypothetical protein
MRKNFRALKRAGMKRRLNEVWILQQKKAAMRTRKEEKV